jgi:hypothetical protein
MLSSTFAALALGVSCLPVVVGQLTGPVGPLTPLAKKTSICNVLDYGGVADNATNIAPAIHKAFAECVLDHPGSVLYVPNGQYLLTESIVLYNATNWAFQLDGLITVWVFSFLKHRACVNVGTGHMEEAIPSRVRLLFGVERRELK